MRGREEGKREAEVQGIAGATARKRRRTAIGMEVKLQEIRSGRNDDGSDGRPCVCATLHDNNVGRAEKHEQQTRRRVI